MTGLCLSWREGGPSRSARSEARTPTPSPSLTGEYTLAVPNDVKSLMLNPARIDPKSTVKVNSKEVSDGDLVWPLNLEIGESRVEIEVTSRPTFLLWGQPSMVYTVNVVRANMQGLPILTLPEGEAVVPEGGTYEAAGSITKVETSPWIGMVDYGDKSATEALVVGDDGSFPLQHIYRDNGVYEVKVRFTYADIGLATASTAVKVTNVAPTLDFTGDAEEYTVDEGSALGLAGRVVDPGADAWTLTADYDDSQGPVPVAVNPDGTFSIQKVFYDEEPSYLVTLAVADDDGGSSNRTFTVNVKNVAPTVDAGPGSVAQRYVLFSRQGSFIDPGLDQWEAFVDYGEWDRRAASWIRRRQGIPS